MVLVYLGTILEPAWIHSGKPWKLKSLGVYRVLLLCQPACCYVSNNSVLEYTWLLLWILSITLSFADVLHTLVCFYNQVNGKGFLLCYSSSWSLDLMLMIKTASVPEKPRDDDNYWTDSHIWTQVTNTTCKELQSARNTVWEHFKNENTGPQTRFPTWTDRKTPKTKKRSRWK